MINQGGGENTSNNCYLFIQCQCFNPYYWFSPVTKRKWNYDRKKMYRVTYINIYV